MSDRARQFCKIHNHPAQEFARDAAAFVANTKFSDSDHFMEIFRPPVYSIIIIANADNKNKAEIGLGKIWHFLNEKDASLLGERPQIYSIEYGSYAGIHIFQIPLQGKDAAQKAQTLLGIAAVKIDEVMDDNAITAFASEYEMPLYTAKSKVRA